MLLIIGGAYQGKLDYAVSRFPDQAVFTCDETSTDCDQEALIIDRFHLLVLAQLRNNIDSMEWIEQNMPVLSDKTIIADDINSGVVPIDKEMRQWRELLGRSLGLLTRNADEVVRVFCGIPTRLK